MFLLDALRCILCCGDDEQQQDFYSYRNNRDFSSFNSTNPRSRSSRENRLYCDESLPLLSPAFSADDSRGKLKFTDVPSSSGDRNRTGVANFPSPSLSSSVSYANNRSSVAALATSRENIQIEVKRHATSQLLKFPSSDICSSTAPASLCPKSSVAAVLSTYQNASGAELSIDHEKLQILTDSATASQLSKVFSSSISSSAADVPFNKPSSSAKDSFLPTVESKGSPSNKPFLASGSSIHSSISVDPVRVWQVKSLITPDSTTKLDERRSSTSSSLPSVQPKGSPSNKPSLASRSSIHRSISVDPVRVWQVKSLITPDSTTKLAERRSSTSPSLPSIRNDAISSVLQSIPHPVHISTANNSVSWQKKSQTSMEPIRESVRDLPTSSSNATSPSSYRKSGESFRRVLPKYEIPKYLEEMIKNDIVPPVLKHPLSSSNYGEIFATLLYAEDFYIEKWNDYLLEGITLELRSRNSVPNSQKMKMNRKNTMLVERDFVAFIIDSVPEKRPYLLSRDFVFLKPLNEFAEPFKGRVYRVIKSTTLLVEFGEDFHSQHSPSKRYDASFSFNRVCLKRAHHAISVASDPSFHNILFPDQSFSSNSITFHLHDSANQIENHVKRILNHKGPIPYLVNGSFAMGIIIVAMLSIYRTNTRCRILVCSPKNITSDLLLKSLMKEIPVSSLFRANAAYRDYDLVPDDVIPASLYEEEEECFACPPLAQLLNFSIITCTFMSSFRLYAAGIDSEHFTHIFLVDASLAIEPEAIVPLAHLAGRSTAIVVTGCLGTSPSWVRSDIARRHGLKKSYFHRLLDREPYKSNDSMFISNLAYI